VCQASVAFEICAEHTWSPDGVGFICSYRSVRACFQTALLQLLRSLVKAIAKPVRRCILMYGKGIKTYITMYWLMSSKNNRAE